MMETQPISTDITKADNSILADADDILLLQKLRAKSQWLIVIAIVFAVISVLLLFSIIEDGVSRGFSGFMIFWAAMATYFFGIVRKVWLVDYFV